MRISDWSSDVCSSDLPVAAGCTEDDVLLAHLLEPLRVRQRLLQAARADRGRADAFETNDVGHPYKSPANPCYNRAPQVIPEKFPRLFSRTAEIASR